MDLEQDIDALVAKLQDTTKNGGGDSNALKQEILKLISKSNAIQKYNYEEGLIKKRIDELLYRMGTVFGILSKEELLSLSHTNLSNTFINIGLYSRLLDNAYDYLTTHVKHNYQYIQDKFNNIKNFMSKSLAIITASPDIDEDFLYSSLDRDLMALKNDLLALFEVFNRGLNNTLFTYTSEKANNGYLSKDKADENVNPCKIETKGLKGKNGNEGSTIGCIYTSKDKDTSVTCSDSVKVANSKENKKILNILNNLIENAIDKKQQDKEIKALLTSNTTVDTSKRLSYASEININNESVFSIAQYEICLDKKREDGKCNILPWFNPNRQAFELYYIDYYLQDPRILIGLNGSCIANSATIVPLDRISQSKDEYAKRIIEHIEKRPDTQCTYNMCDTLNKFYNTYKESKAKDFNGDFYDYVQYVRNKVKLFTASFDSKSDSETDKITANLCAATRCIVYNYKGNEPYKNLDYNIRVLFNGTEDDEKIQNNITKETKAIIRESAKDNRLQNKYTTEFVDLMDSILWDKEKNVMILSPLTCPIEVVSNLPLFKNCSYNIGTIVECIATQMLAKTSKSNTANIIYGMSNVLINDKTMIDLINNFARVISYNLRQELINVIQGEKVIQMDETALRVLDVEDKIYGYLYALNTPYNASYRVSLYFYDKSRCYEAISNILNNFPNIKVLCTDGYAPYETKCENVFKEYVKEHGGEVDSVPLRHASCLAHARRKIHEALQCKDLVFVYNVIVTYISKNNLDNKSLYDALLAIENKTLAQICDMYNATMVHKANANVTYTKQDVAKLEIFFLLNLIFSYDREVFKRYNALLSINYNEVVKEVEEELLAIRQSKSKVAYNILFEKIKEYNDNYHCFKKVIISEEGIKASAVNTDEFNRALSYIFTRYISLQEFINNASIELTTNRAERSIKEIIYIRAQSLSMHNNVGAHALACNATVCNTCIHNNVNIRDYLLWVLANLRIRAQFAIEALGFKTPSDVFKMAKIVTREVKDENGNVVKDDKGNIVTESLNIFHEDNHHPMDYVDFTGLDVFSYLDYFNKKVLPDNYDEDRKKKILDFIEKCTRSVGIEAKIKNKMTLEELDTYARERLEKEISNVEFCERSLGTMFRKVAHNIQKYCLVVDMKMSVERKIRSAPKPKT